MTFIPDKNCIYIFFSEDYWQTMMCGCYTACDVRESGEPRGVEWAACTLKCSNTILANSAGICVRAES